MSTSRLLALLAVLLFSPLISLPAIAGATDPLFVNATTDDPHRAKMALVFSKGQLERKHPVAIFLNDRAVMIGSRANAARFKEQQELLKALVDAGATVLICPMCMAHYGVTEADLMPGIKVGNPEAVGSALFGDKTKTLTW